MDILVAKMFLTLTPALQTTKKYSKGKVFVVGVFFYCDKRLSIPSFNS